MEENRKLKEIGKYRYVQTEERLGKLKEAIREGKNNINDLVRITGVSARTVKRDIAFLRKQGDKIGMKRVYVYKEGEDGEEEGWG